MIRRARPLLGTFVEITADGAAAVLSAAVEAAFAAIAQVQGRMSFHDPDSDVSRINGAAAGQEIDVHPRTFHVLKFARHLSELSEGAFDITAAAILVENGFLPQPPCGQGVVGVAYRDLDLLAGNCVRWRRKGWIDLGGIAKGYAVDCAIAELRAHRVVIGVVNAGGDLRCFGEAQPVHVRHPEVPTTLMQLGWLSNAALATSAGYFSGVDGRSGRIDPLVDPGRHKCTRWGGSVSIVARAAMTADALTKVIRLKPELASTILDRFGAQAIVIDRHGARCCGRSLLRSHAAT